MAYTHSAMGNTMGPHGTNSLLINSSLLPGQQPRQHHFPYPQHQIQHQSYPLPPTTTAALPASSTIVHAPAPAATTLASPQPSPRTPQYHYPAAPATLPPQQQALPLAPGSTHSDNDNDNDTIDSNSDASAVVGPARPPENTRRRPIPRKGHTKSRTGCFNCKRRKVKCQENQPRCAQCQRLGLSCEYPISQKTVLSVHSNVTHGAPPHAVPSALELQDLKFFYHFMTDAYPPLPLGCDEVWKRTAGMSSNYDFLAHAILGLAASHLGLCTGEDYKSKALSHRVTAINLLNEKLSQPCKNQQDGDALFGAVMVLAFQAAYLPDAMLEFVTMVRGCDVVSKRMMPDFASSQFNTLTAEGHASSMQQLITAQGEDSKNSGLMNGFITSVALLDGLCQTEFERAYYTCLQSVIETARSSYAGAWAEFTRLYMLPSAMTNDEFSAFAQPDNWTSQLLLVHMFILDFMLGDFVLHGSQRISRAMRKKILVTWIERLGERLPPGYQHYIDWPLTYGKIMIEHQRTNMVPTQEYLSTFATLRTQKSESPRSRQDSQTPPSQDSMDAYPSPSENEYNLWLPTDGIRSGHC
ncbi:uncharacterized protein B0I36DRAFT_133500 [Microdochium trichocladiopsis]|uniref:Zn(2)-C6 fungal-type domain-containing protein n=1 Tax=Microdochium trichocladiopsis TaxID=1682393 RepID=A0A9P9BME4_9PEZI|nr:uncharacterized protein B0I36DRAFT_133500 [Microdochium trichocladiopsis]KAH7029528.1 hypothetical protein B0I36DRAFT_133500 [Microdochium trichocladiopsis]